MALLAAGDSMYITPFTPHTFTTRSGAKQNGLILALTYGNKLTGDIQQELSAISSELGQEYALDFSGYADGDISYLWHDAGETPCDFDITNIEFFS